MTRYVVGAQDADISGKSDPYVRIEFPEHHGAPRRQATHVIKNTLSPLWETTRYALLTDECESFKCTVFDEDVSRDDSLGHVNIVRADHGHRHERQGGWFALERGRNGRVEIFFQEVEIPDGFGHLWDHFQDAMYNVGNHEWDILEITLHDGEKCKGGGLFGKPDPYAKIVFEDLKEERLIVPEEHLRTHHCDSTHDPVWDTTFHYLINSSDVTQFTCKVMDKDVLSDDCLGHVRVNIVDLNDESSQKYKLEDGKGIVRISQKRVPLLEAFFSHH